MWVLFALPRGTASVNYRRNYGFGFGKRLKRCLVLRIFFFFFLINKYQMALSPFPTLRQKFNACSPVYVDCKFGFSVTDFLSQISFGQFHNVVLFVCWSS